MALRLLSSIGTLVRPSPRNSMLEFSRRDDWRQTSMATRIDTQGIVGSNLPSSCISIKGIIPKDSDSRSRMMIIGYRIRGDDGRPLYSTLENGCKELILSRLCSKYSSTIVPNASKYTEQTIKDPHSSRHVVYDLVSSRNDRNSRPAR